MTITKFRAFLATVECGSFTEAAKRLYYTQSAVSRMVSDLESQWGVALLNRKKTGLTLTPAGAALLPYIRQICSDEMRLNGVLQDMTGLKQGVVRLGTVTAVANEWLPIVLKKLMQEAPGIEYEVLIGNGDVIDDWLKEDRIDVGLFTPKRDGNLNAELLHLDEFRVIFPKEHPLSKYKKIPLRVLQDYPYILHGASWCKELENGLKHGRQRIPVRYTTVGATSIVNLVKAGIGVSILPELLLENDKTKVESRPLDPPLYRKLFVVTHGTPTMPAVKVFLERLPALLKKRAKKS
ncbi:MAG TPA: LysR family transcriptional regulator [Candidatus Aphodousia faecalis]|nr:LysR family transcriptional regulator [Candidatus Aphodousia faecalis]